MIFRTQFVQLLAILFCGFMLSLSPAIASSLDKAPENINGDILYENSEKSPTDKGGHMGALGISTKSFNGKKGMVVVFLSSKCPCSNSHIPELKKLAEKYVDFHFLAINSNADETFDQAQKYFELVKLPFPAIRDRKSQAADAFKALKTPHAFLVAAGGEILYQGGVTSSANAAEADKHFLNDALVDAQLGKKVRVAEGRTLGCVIKREGEKNDWK